MSCKRMSCWYFKSSQGLQKIARINVCVNRSVLMKFLCFVLLLAGMGYIVVSRFIRVKVIYISQ